MPYPLSSIGHADIILWQNDMWFIPKELLLFRLNYKLSDRFQKHWQTIPCYLVVMSTQCWNVNLIHCHLLKQAMSNMYQESQKGKALPVSD